MPKKLIKVRNREKTMLLAMLGQAVERLVEIGRQVEFVLGRAEAAPAELEQQGTEVGGVRQGRLVRQALPDLQQGLEVGV